MIMTCDASEITQPIQFSSSLWISRSKATKGGAGPGRGTLSLIFPQNGVPPSLCGYRVASGEKSLKKVTLFNIENRANNDELGALAFKSQS